MRRSVLLSALVLALLVTGGAVGAGLLQRGTPPRVRAVVSASVPDDATALAVLRGWDARRSRAWSRGDASALRALYVAGSSAGARDLAMLRAWQRRGVRVHGLRMQVLRADVRVVRDDRLVIRVLDRVARGWAERGGIRTQLPSGAATPRTITLVRRPGGWRVAEVQLSPGRWPAPR